jgi:Fic family protein
MMTLKQFSAEPESIPTGTGWYLADLGVAQGHQELYTRQSPQKLKVLREHALIESAVSSNRIEGVTVDQARVGTILFGRPALKDRDEEEVRGYRDALRLIHEGSGGLSVSVPTIRRLHRLCRGEIWDAGRFKEKDVDIIEKYPDGRQRVRFKPVPAGHETRQALAHMVSLYRQGLRERWVHPLILLAGMNLDFLCIHPFRDGNGRVSRLLLLLACYQQGCEVGRYISIERVIEQNKDRYYETLEQSSLNWHQGKHNPWHYVNYILFILKTAYREFEDRMGQVRSPRGEKSELIRRAVAGKTQPFRIADLQRDCPGVSTDMIRHVLKDLRAEGQVECLGRGKSAQWSKTAK